MTYQWPKRRVLRRLGPLPRRSTHRISIINVVPINMV